MENNTVNISNISLIQQVRDLPADIVQELKALFESCGITTGLMLKMLQEKNLIAEGVNCKPFYNAMVKVHGFKQRKSHGFLLDHPHLMVTWDWEKNAEAGLDPAKLTLRSREAAFFKCPAGIHNSEKRRIQHHTAGHGCSKCGHDAKAKANSTPKLGESLAELMPGIAEQYMDWLNKRPATMIKPGVDDDAFWMPPCGKHNQYKMLVYERTKKPEEYCPYWNMASEYEKYWYDLVSDFLNPLGIKVYANQHILEPNKDMDIFFPGIPQGPEVDIWIPYLNIGIEINTKRNHNKEKGTKVCPLGYERNKSFRAMIQGIYLDHVWQSDHEQNPEQEETRILNSLRVAMHQKGMPIAIDWDYSGDWGESA